ncbi:hypothetical protein [Rhodocaloribacter sp.]
MELMRCETCASESMAPVEVMVHDENATPIADEQESYFYTCHVCGDNWLSIKEKREDGDTRITVIHQMGMSPMLKRVGRLEPSFPSAEGTVGHWTYFMDEDEITEDVWREKLSARRRILKSICTN